LRARQVLMKTVCISTSSHRNSVSPSSRMRIFRSLSGSTAGNIDGTAADYDGSKLATGGPLGVPTVVVTINYRLGLFGFLAHPALDAENHPFANYGIMDIQAALHWVQRNAAAFGGDPSHVTLGGQSAGATDTGANVISPLSAGLFHRAIFQSSPTNALAPLSLGLERGTAFAMAAGCSA